MDPGRRRRGNNGKEASLVLTLAGRLLHARLLRLAIRGGLGLGLAFAGLRRAFGRLGRSGLRRRLLRRGRIGLLELVGGHRRRRALRLGNRRLLVTRQDIAPKRSAYRKWVPIRDTP